MRRRRGEEERGEVRDVEGRSSSEVMKGALDLWCIRCLGLVAERSS